MLLRQLRGGPASGNERQVATAAATVDHYQGHIERYICSDAPSSSRATRSWEYEAPLRTAHSWSQNQIHLTQVLIVLHTSLLLHCVNHPPVFSVYLVCASIF